MIQTSTAFITSYVTPTIPYVLSGRNINLRGKAPYNGKVIKVVSLHSAKCCLLMWPGLESCVQFSSLYLKNETAELEKVQRSAGQDDWGVEHIHSS